MKWDFKHRPDRFFKYEAYYSPQGPEMRDLYAWCWQTFGHPGSPYVGYIGNVNGGGQWDSHGGWIKLKGEEELVIFKLRWCYD